VAVVTSPCYLMVFTAMKQLMMTYYELLRMGYSDQLRQNEANVTNLLLFLTSMVESQFYF
jgi:hypothetical protein